MAQRLISPFVQLLDDASVLRDGARLFFYATGTSTKINTYSDAARTTSNSNPIVLDEFGQPTSGVFGLNVDYKIVLAGPGSEDPPTNVIRTIDPVSSSDFGSLLQTTTGAANPNGSVAGTAASAGVLPSTFWDYTNKVLYFCTVTGDAATAVWTAINASSATPAVPPAQGYLTLTSATPVILADVTAATSVYYTPDAGNLVPIYNGSSFSPTAFTELTLALSSSHVASNIYDVFIFNNSGVPTIVTGPSWSAGTSGSITAGSCARGTGVGGAALSRVNGLFVNAVQITGRNGATTYTIGANLATYVGSILIDGTNGQISCHRAFGQSRKWGVWNAYNRKPLWLIVGDGTASWVSAPTTWRVSRAQTVNSLITFCGLAEEAINLQFVQMVDSLTSNSSSNANIGIGLNSATAAVGKIGENRSVTATGTIAALRSDLVASYQLAPAIGQNLINAIEQASVGTTNNTFFGSEAYMRLTANWRG